VGAPYRIAAPPPPEPPDAFDAYEVELRARLRRGHYASILGFLIVAGGWFALAGFHRAEDRAARQHELARRAQEEATRRESDLRGVLGRERDEAFEQEGAFRSALAAAVAQDIAPAVAHGEPCAVELLSEARLVGGKTIPLVILDPGEVAHSPRTDARLASIAQAERLLDAGHWPDAGIIARALNRKLVGPEVFVVASLHRHPVSQTGSSFEPGSVRGTAYVYDVGERRVVCAGAVEAVSSQTIEYAYVADPSSLASDDQGPRLNASLEADLDRQLRRAAQASLRTVR
jgi:hypothetical protein